MYYDIHCHVFNKAIIDKRMDILLAPMFKIIDGLDNKLPETSIFELIDKGDNFLDAFMKMSSAEVFEALDAYYNHEFVLTPLMMDLEFTDSENLGKLEEIKQRVVKEIMLELADQIRSRVRKAATAYPQLAEKMQTLTRENKFLLKFPTKQEIEVFEKNNFQNQVEELETIARECPRVKPFLGIDARRSKKQNLTQLVQEKILGEGALFAGVKLYAPTGFSPTDPALFGENGVYQLCEKHGIPITVHNSNEGFSTHVSSVKVTGLVNLNNKLVQMENEVVRFGVPFFSLRARTAIKERALTLNHPRIWEKVFEKYPNLKLNLAHFGGKAELLKFTIHEIEEKKLSGTEFLDLMGLVERLDDRKIIESCFVKKEIKLRGKVIRTSYVLNKKIDAVTQEKLWNILYTVGWQDNWSNTILDIITRYPNAYTDLSCFASGKTIDGVFSIKESLAQFKTNIYDKMPETVKNKVLYGSDFFFVLLFGPTMENYIAEFKTVFGDEFDRIASRNPERFLGINPAPKTIA